ncbi:MAP kinase [Coniochaeta sp. PMI_546]|nr:MAP kinase [Coniochaeta sp. PMI_546]
MATETSPRAVRFTRDDDELLRLDNDKPTLNVTTGSDESVSSGDFPADSDHTGLEQQDGLGSLNRYAEVATHSGSMTSLVAPPHANGTTRHRTATDPASMSYTNGTPRGPPQRPTAPARTPSNTYQPYTQRRPGQANQGSFMTGPHARDGSRPRPIGTSTFRAQEREYVRRLRQQDHNNEYFVDPYASGEQFDSDSEGETPSSEVPFDGLDQETNLFTNSEHLQPTDEDLKDPQNRERLEWHGMLEAVLTGDVVRQEKKRLIGSSEEQLGKNAQKAEIWIGLRSKICGRHLPVQRRMIEDARGNLDSLIGEIINFSIAGESEAGKPPVEQVRDVVAKIEKVEGLYPSRTTLIAHHKLADSDAFRETCDAVISWYNINEMINTELSILKKWVGNDDLDFRRSKDQSPNGNGLSDESSFLDRLMKEEGLKSLHDDPEEDRQNLRKRSMLYGISRVIMKAKESLILNAHAFATRHLPPYIEELLTLISFPSRLIEEVVKVRLAYAKKMKDSAQQNLMMQDQMITQFQVLLNLAIKIKQEYLMISQPEPGWDLPPCIDENFDQVILDALKYYFKMLNWKLSGNKNTFKEAELLFQEWDFANEIGRYLQHGDVEVAEQFSSLTYKALNRLSQTFERELQRKPKESVAEMTKRYKQILDSVRVRQRMLQRFSRMLSDNYENACDFTIAFGPEKLQELYERLVETGHFQIHTGALEKEGVILIASPSLRDRPEDIQMLMGTYSYETPMEDPSDPYVLLLRPEDAPHWFGDKIDLTIREEPLDLRLGHMRLIAGGSQARLVNARKSFLDYVDMQIDLVVEQRSTLHKVNQRLMENRKVAYKLSNAFMESVEIIRRQTQGLDCQDLIQTCFIFATEFGQRSLLYMDSNRRQMNNLKLTKLALDWVSFICDDCVASDRKTFRWAVLALEFAMGMTRGRHILALGDEEYARLRAKVAGCMSLLISHFDIMGARSSIAAQAEKQRMEALMVQLKRLNKGQVMDDSDAAKCVTEHRLEEIAKVDELRKEILLERSALGRVLEASNEVDRSLAWLSSTANNFTMRWQQGHFVGGGTFGNVYAAMNLDTGHLMAVKEIRLQDPKLIPTIAGQIRDEMRVLESIDHPNVVSYYGIEVHRDRVYIFMEFCSGGSLANLLEHGRIEDEQVIMVYALQLLEGLAYLHEVKIAHRDIKPENILLDHNGIIKYVDFGAAKVIARQGRTLVQDLTSTKPNKSMTGTPMYMSPEVIKGENPGHFGAVDVWSLGCVILEMATGRRPWANLDNEWAIMYNIAQGNPPPLPTPDQLSPQGIDFLKRCFVRDSKKRATAIELLQHEWIMTIRNRVVEPSTPSETSSTQSTPNTSSVSSKGDGFYL